jgi:DNA-binding transcriptional ArsR family regulator
LIDRIRNDIQHRLDQLHAEADKLRHALAALDPRGRSTPARRSTPTPAAARRAASPSSAAKPAPAPAARRAASTSNGAAGASARTAPGQTKAKVLAALSTDNGLTAGEVAKATGLARPTVSTTLSKLSKTGEVVKAERGYRLPGARTRTATAAKPAGATTTRA